MESDSVSLTGGTILAITPTCFFFHYPTQLPSLVSLSWRQYNSSMWPLGSLLIKTYLMFCYLFQKLLDLSLPFFPLIISYFPTTWAHGLIQLFCLSSGDGLGIVLHTISPLNISYIWIYYWKFQMSHCHSLSYSFNLLNDSLVRRHIKEMQKYWYVNLINHFSWNQAALMMCSTNRMFLSENYLADFRWGGHCGHGMWPIPDRHQISLLFFFMPLCEIDGVIDSHSLSVLVTHYNPVSVCVYAHI